MGEDIHMKWYIKSKVGSKAGKYVSAMEVMSNFDTSDKYDFGNLFDFRSYDFFSMLGSRRSDWREFKYLNQGFPEWFATEFPTERAMLKMKGNNYYSFSWITFNDFVVALKDRMRQLSDVKTYYSEAPDADSYSRDLLELLDRDPNSDEAQNFVRRFNEESKNLIEICKETLKRLAQINEYYSDEEFQSIFDINETVILFWFDC